MEDNDTRYSRQIMLKEIGQEGQARLRRASVLIVGLGGLGAPVATYLTGAGVGRIGLADSDTVSLSNLQRQTLYSESQIGRKKTDCACERLSALFSETKFELFPDGLTAQNAEEIIGRFDLIVDCTDNFQTRYLIDDVCALKGIPWVYGSIGEFSGQVSVFGYRKRRRYSELFPDRETLTSIPPRVRGVLGAVPGAIGSIQACEAVKLLAGFGKPLEGRLLMIDFLTATTDIIDF